MAGYKKKLDASMLHGFAQHNLRDRISQYETPQNSTVTSQNCGKAQTHAKQSQIMCLQYKVLKKKQPELVNLEAPYSAVTMLNYRHFQLFDKHIKNLNGSFQCIRRMVASISDYHLFRPL